MDDYYDEEDDKIIRIHPTTGATLTRDIRPLTIAGQIIQVQGWYPADDGDAIFEADGLAVIAKAQNEALQRLAEATGTTVDRLTRDQRRSALTMP
ncbi:hypothetical protein IL54_4613 [Sphingobium sp. ba1]|jgi:hypothetical protein|nr:hypothetical protein IL54_4613 [Sphingobium sp. ba1]